ITALIPQIKTLFMQSVEGLTYDQVSVTAVAAVAVDLARSRPAAVIMPPWVVGLLGFGAVSIAGEGLFVVSWRPWSRAGAH
ncbi:EscJ/YscJ/HrcJ family type III secretion inner membrane ring protein, partial [Burkholderia pseudomallei]